MFFFLYSQENYTFSIRKFFQQIFFTWFKWIWFMIDFEWILLLFFENWNVEFFFVMTCAQYTTTSLLVISHMRRIVIFSLFFCLIVICISFVVLFFSSINQSTRINYLIIIDWCFFFCFAKKNMNINFNRSVDSMWNMMITFFFVAIIKHKMFQVITSSFFPFPRKKNSSWLTRLESRFIRFEHWNRYTNKNHS